MFTVYVQEPHTERMVAHATFNDYAEAVSFKQNAERWSAGRVYILEA